jgi:hypothetical protein
MLLDLCDVAGYSAGPCRPFGRIVEKAPFFI